MVLNFAGRVTTFRSGSSLPLCTVFDDDFYLEPADDLNSDTVCAAWMVEELKSKKCKKPKGGGDVVDELLIPTMVLDKAEVSVAFDTLATLAVAGSGGPSLLETPRAKRAKMCGKLIINLTVHRLVMNREHPGWQAS